MIPRATMPSRRRLLLLAVQLFAFAFLVRTVYWTAVPRPAWETHRQTQRPMQDGRDVPLWLNLTAQDVPLDVDLYVESIMDPKSTAKPRFDCPSINTRRYDHLKATPGFLPRPTFKYLFALALRDEGVELLPRLMASVVEAMVVLGPSSCALSMVVGGGKPDGLYDVLLRLKPRVESLGVKFYLQRPDLPTEGVDRVDHLARVRNFVLKPMIDPSAGDTGRFTQHTAVVFLNDVAACTEDILELAHQHRVQQADMVCAMDWIGDSYYDVWIGRTLAGDTFFRIPPENETWDFAGDLFFNPKDGEGRKRFADHRPVQVFSCWNGGVVFGARPLLGGNGLAADPRRKEDPVRFRGRLKDGAGDECYSGEPALFAKDLWFRGHGRIAVIPSVNFDYSMQRGLDTKEKKGWVSDRVGDKGAELGEEEGVEPERIEWQGEPPDEVNCARVRWSKQEWVRWNEGLV